MTEPAISIIMGSDSDLPTMEGAIAICEQFAVRHEVAIISAHRTPLQMVEFATTAHTRGRKIIIAGAGGAAHLPGMVAALTPLPVIGVPVPSKHLQGLDSLYSIVQMPKGIPVATVAIANAENAGLLAIQMLAVHDAQLQEKILTYRHQLTQMVQEKQEKLHQIGASEYLKQQKSRNIT
ncbi:MAG: 5-(carboxyamino)imidazole ribonucleotide mutase [Oscillatoriales cyanobacterium SM2_2_1]|nr:5-(carboxyamino)imidazole ribonucleotide mutase [Oscillatoriales cyanobacterium SM2_2_1]